MGKENDFQKKLEALDQDFKRIQENFEDSEIEYDSDSNSSELSIKRTSEIRFEKLDKEYAALNQMPNREKNIDITLETEENNALYSDMEDGDGEYCEEIKKGSGKLYIAGSIILLVIIGGIIYGLLTAPDKLYGESYENALALMQKGEYSDAIEEFNKTGNYKDSVSLTRECRYLHAEELFKSKKYQEACEVFSVLTPYKESESYIKECKYISAKQLLEQGEHLQALEIFSQISNYKDVQNILSGDLFSTGMQLLQQGKYEQAYDFFDKSATIKNRDVYMAVCETYIFENSSEEPDQSVLEKNYHTLSKSDWDIAKEATINSIYSFIRLKGNWTDAEGHYYFNFEDSFAFNLPIGSSGDKNALKFKINKSDILGCSNYDSVQAAEDRIWKKYFEIVSFTPADAALPDSMNIKTIFNNNVYTLYRTI